MRLLHGFLKHRGRQIADRACYGSAPKAQFYLCYYLPTASVFLSGSPGREQIC